MWPALGPESECSSPGAAQAWYVLAHVQALAPLRHREFTSHLLGLLHFIRGRVSTNRGSHLCNVGQAYVHAQLGA